MSKAGTTTATAIRWLPGTFEERELVLVELDAILASHHFRNSKRYPALLKYVVDKTLDGHAEDLKERTLGVEVFDRQPDYDTNADPVVRVSAGEIRKRIAQYYHETGEDSPLQIELPLGSYVPEFKPRVALAERDRGGAGALAGEESSELERVAELERMPRDGEVSLVERRNRSQLPQDSLSRQRPPLSDATRSTSSLRMAGISAGQSGTGRTAHVLWAVLSVALAIACLVVIKQNHTLRQALNPWEGKPALGAFWEDFLRFNQQTDLVLPDDTLSVIEDISHQPVSLNDYLNHAYMRNVQSSEMSADRKWDLDNISRHNLITFGGVRAAQVIQSRIPGSYPTNLTLSRYYSAESIKRDNAILIGGKKANPWVRLLDDKTTFSLDYDETRALGYMANRNPQAGEQAKYFTGLDPGGLIGYAAIAYLPNPSHTGNVVILAGTDSDATSAAAEFLASEEQLGNFLAKTHLKRFPYFEILIKTSRLSGTSLNSEPIAYRTYPNLH